jgi:hypothetical protein
MNREAVAPIAFGLNGPFVRDLKEVGVAVVVAGNENCEVYPACGLILDKAVSGRVLSEFVCCRNRDEVSVDLEDG